MSNPFDVNALVVKKAKIQPSTTQDIGSVGPNFSNPAPPAYAEIMATSALSESIFSDALDKYILCGVNALLLFAGGSLLLHTKMDELNDTQFRFVCASYLGLFPLIVLGYMAYPWITITLSIVGAFFGYTFVGSPRTTVKLKEMSALCLSGACIAAWIENIGSAMFGSMTGYGAPLTSLLKPKTALGYTLCRAPIVLSVIGLITIGLRQITVNSPKPSRPGTIIICITAATLIMNGICSIIYLLTTRVGSLHPFPFFGGPTKMILGTQECSLSLVVFVLLAAATYLLRDSQLQSAMRMKYVEGTSRQQTEELASLTQSRNRAEIWRRSFSGGQSIEEGSAGEDELEEGEIRESSSEE